MALDTDTLERVLNRVHDWTRSADTKTDVLIAIQTVVLGVLLDDVVAWFLAPATQASTQWAIGLGLSSLVIGIARALLALFPRTRDVRKKPTPRKKSITFFGDIAAMEYGEFRSRVREISDEELREEFISQIHISSVVAAIKHHHIKVSVVSFGAGLMWLALVRVIGQLLE